MVLSANENQAWDAYEAHLKSCVVCSEQYRLAEEGEIDACCEIGKKLVHQVQNIFAAALKRAGYPFAL